MDVRIVILNYNGEKLLRECLPSILEASRRARHPTRLTVIDNCSRDKSVEILKSEFPEFDIYLSKENRVLCTYNEYLKKIEEPVVILLNNDIRVAPDFVDPLMGPFQRDGEIFMVTPRCLSFDGSHYEGGRSKSLIRYGLFWTSCIFDGYLPRIEEPGPTMAAGFGAFHREKFLALGGYDDLYLPGRLEDNDLCFRAWKKGWKSLYEPHSVVFHQGASSFNERFGARETLALSHRNSFLFLWKNITDVVYLFQHFALLLPRLLHALLTGNFPIVLGFLRALPLVPEALGRRKKVLKEKALLSDQQIFGMVK